MSTRGRPADGWERRVGRTALVSGAIAALFGAFSLQEKSDLVLILGGIAWLAFVVAVASAGLWLALGVRRDRRRPR
jgi:hypothetical protein